MHSKIKFNEFQIFGLEYHWEVLSEHHRKPRESRDEMLDYELIELKLIEFFLAPLPDCQAFFVFQTLKSLLKSEDSIRLSQIANH